VQQQQQQQQQVRCFCQERCDPARIGDWWRVIICSRVVQQQQQQQQQQQEQQQVRCFMEGENQRALATGGA
jgi:hypothetical protein